MKINTEGVQKPRLLPNRESSSGEPGDGKRSHWEEKMEKKKEPVTDRDKEAIRISKSLP